MINKYSTYLKDVHRLQDRMGPFYVNYTRPSLPKLSTASRCLAETNIHQHKNLYTICTLFLRRTVEFRGTRRNPMETENNYKPL